jgi:hypothetical protein
MTLNTEQIKLSLVLDPSFTPTEEGFLFEDWGLLGLYDALVAGATVPLVMGGRRASLPLVLGAAIFFQRDLLLHPKCLPLLLQGEYFEMVGSQRSIHMQEDLHAFFEACKNFLGEGSPKELAHKVTVATQWVREYVLEGRLPNLGLIDSITPEILDEGTNGFVLAKGSSETVVRLFRMGYLRGLVVDLNASDSLIVTVFRKSDRVGFDLVQARVLLDEMERMSGSDLRWGLEGDRLLSPAPGTDLLLSDIVEVLLHV